MNLESIHLSELAERLKPADQTTMLLLGTRLSELRLAANCEVKCYYSGAKSIPVLSNCIALYETLNAVLYLVGLKCIWKMA